MHSLIKQTLGLAAVALVLASSAEAQGRGKGKHKDREINNGILRDDGIYRDGRDGIYRDGRDGIYRDGRDGIYRDGRDGIYRDGRDGIYRDGRDGIYRDGRKVPPGLAKKPGHMPPGQYKKRYGAYEGSSILGEIMRRRGYDVRRNVAYGDSRYVYYRLNNGVERRAIVYPGADRLMFDNVPSQVLQAVLARLY